jgi:uncharacterized protein (DUF924 family)
MQDIPSDVVAYNRSIAAKLREIFTPVCAQLSQCADKITSQDVQACIDDLTVCLVDYQRSQYDQSQQLPPAIESVKTASSKKPDLTKNEKLYFNSFLKHLNEIALLKPYNLAEFLSGRFQQYLWAPLYNNQTEANNHAAETSVIPIGEYGIDNALLMLLTTQLLSRLTDRLTNEALKAETAEWGVLSVETLRGRKKAEKIEAGGITDIISVLDTLKEGVQSLQATISSLTAKKISDLTFDCLLELVIEKNFPQRIAVKVPFSYTLPSVRQGIYHENVFNYQTGQSDDLTLSTAFLEYCTATQHIYRHSRLVSDGKRNPGLLGTGCPVAQKQCGFEMIGINYMAKAYLGIYRHLQKTINLQQLKHTIFTVNLGNPSLLPKPLDKPDELKTYNVDLHALSAARERVSELTHLQQLSDDILRFWFGHLPIDAMPAAEIRDKWFTQDVKFDEEIQQKFAPMIEQVMQGKFLKCKRTATQTLALVILLDQFSRNAYRGSAKAYACDGLAAQLAMQAISEQQDKLLPPVCRWFLYMPLQHAENRLLQKKSVEVFLQLRQEANNVEDQQIFDDVLRHATEHCKIVEHFGRFPHRNKLLGRDSSAEEVNYLRSLEPAQYYNKDYFNKTLGITTQYQSVQTPLCQSKKSLQSNNFFAYAFFVVGATAYMNSSKDNYKMQFLGLLMIMVGLSIGAKINVRVANLYDKGMGFFNRLNNAPQAHLPNATIYQAKLHY